MQVTKCEDPRCGTCDLIEQGPTKKLKNGKELKVNTNMNCKSRNLIYCITCPGCDEFYIGETKTKLTSRVNVHRHQIKNAALRCIPCSEHLDICAQGDFKIFPFHKINEENDLLRKTKEEYFIGLLNPKLNRK